VELKLLVCSDVNLIDSATNRVSCINLVELIASPQFPVILPLFSILAVFTKDDGDLDEEPCEMLIRMNDEELVRAPFVVSFQGGEMHRAVSVLQGFALNVPGTLKVAVNRNEVEMRAWTIPVKQVDPMPIRRPPA
jgi:hypothetical protein